MKNNTSNTASNTKMIVLFVMLLFSGFTMAAQTVDHNTETATANATAVEANPNLNMVSWFMGTKQTAKETISNDGTVGKKQMINSGIAPNRLLIKAFLKKANNYQSTIA